MKDKNTNTSKSVIEPKFRRNTRWLLHVNMLSQPHQVKVVHTPKFIARWLKFNDKRSQQHFFISTVVRLRDSWLRVQKTNGRPSRPIISFFFWRHFGNSRSQICHKLCRNLAWPLFCLTFCQLKRKIFVGIICEELLPGAPGMFMDTFQLKYPVRLRLEIEASGVRGQLDPSQPLHSEPVIIASVDRVRLDVLCTPDVLCTLDDVLCTLVY